ncbi:hypothetical protein [Komagataeibacter xylinus]|uniref:hypothetical protein n=1 Tax=Komagataeibacter xylinus TaxID=28448 RepID=UPI000B1DB462|nr:hypothetical protein [Komagataeibacter xylinus]GBQ69026.1 hypothetical protein AA15237_0521 [Komagataeibacter xylinus NBRC 15237]
MSTDNYNLYSLIVSLLSSIIALIMLFLAYKQLKELNGQVTIAVKANSISSLNTLLSLEDHISQMRKEFSKDLISVLECKKTGGDTSILELKLDESKQMYFNSLDRLCFCVKKNMLDDDDARKDYKEAISSLIKQYPEDFGPSSTYSNILIVYESWRDK